MLTLYLIMNSEKAAIIAMSKPEDLSTDLWGGDYEMHEIGKADWNTPPGALLCGPRSEVTRFRPIGQKIERVPSHA
jgi:hypothetical protein